MKTLVKLVSPSVVFFSIFFFKKCFSICIRKLYIDRKLANRLFSSIVFAITAVVLLTILQLFSTYQQVYASATGLEVIVRTTTNSDNPDTTPVIMLVRDSETFGIAESLLIADDGTVATSEVVFQFLEGAIENGEEFFACAIFLENNGQISTACDIAENSDENRPEIVNLNYFN
jgi:hypothetical protein